MDTYIFVLFMLVILAVFWVSLYVIVPWIFRRVYQRIFQNRFQQSRYVSITFDDGPHPQRTPAVLDILAKHNIKATFFVVGRFAEKYPDLMQRIQNEGHDIGLHGYNHWFSWTLSPWKTIQDIRMENRSAKKYIQSRDPILYRPPFGKFNLASLLYVLCSKRTIILWTLDSLDHASNTVREIVDRVMANIQSNSIILFHDGTFSSSTSAILVEALDTLLTTFSQKNFVFETISNRLEGLESKG